MTAEQKPLGLSDFDVIMGIDRIYSCYVKLDYRARTIRFEFPNISVIGWKGNDVMQKGRFISYLKTMEMITNGCIYHMDREAEAPTWL